MTSLAETVETLREAVTQLQAALAPPVSFAEIGRFSPSEAVTLSAILKWEVASFEQILMALYAARPDDQPGATILRVFVNRIRGKLAPHGIEVLSWYGTGYRMPPASKSRLRSLMAAAAP